MYSIYNRDTPNQTLLVVPDVRPDMVNYFVWSKEVNKISWLFYIGKEKPYLIGYIHFNYGSVIHPRLIQAVYLREDFIELLPYGNKLDEIGTDYYFEHSEVLYEFDARSAVISAHALPEAAVKGMVTSKIMSEHPYLLEGEHLAGVVTNIDRDGEISPDRKATVTDSDAEWDVL